MKVTLTQRPSLTARVGSKDPILVNQSATAGARVLNDLLDVQAVNRVDGSVLVFDEAEGVFVATRILEKQDINGGHF